MGAARRAGRDGHRAGRSGGRCHLPTTKAAWVPATRVCAGHPRRRHRSRVTTGVSTLSPGWECTGAPFCSRFSGEGLAARSWGWDGSSGAIGLCQALISSPAVHFPPQRSGAGPAALPERGWAHRPPQAPGELRDGRMFSRRNARPPFIPSMGPGGRWMRGRGAVPGWVWGRKGLSRGSLLTLSNDLNQTERFCHPSR